MKLAFGSPFLLLLLGSIAIVTDLLIATCRRSVTVRLEVEPLSRQAS